MSCLLFTAGTHIEQVARELVVSALAAGEPVSTNFNGIELVARPGEKAPDIVARFHAERERQAEAFACSVEGRAQAQAGQREIAAGQRSHDTLVSALAGLDWSSDTAVLDWVCALQRATERSGVAVERARIVRAFEAHGFQANANVDQAHDACCRDNAFRWIIGQVLDALKSEKPPHPILLRFADQWRAAFLPPRDAQEGERR